MTIRPAQRSDLTQILELLSALNENGSRIDDRYRIREDGPSHLRSMLMDSWFGRFLPFEACWVAEHDAQLVAFVSGEPVVTHLILEHAPTARIDNLYVAPSHRRKGLARQLVARFGDRAAQAGYPRLVVSTLARDHQALSLWRSLGFDDLRISLSREEA